MPDQRRPAKSLEKTPSRVRCECGYGHFCDLARPLFRRSLLPPRGKLPGCHTEQETSFDCLAEDIAPSPKEGEDFLLKRHSQSAAFETPADQQAPGDHPGSSTPSRISDDLRLKTWPFGWAFGRSRC